ncbi:hypothetical protein QE152_g4985 [Popillia japonica]|uniref:Uncharacterized protein n=1 Tax=Popillia japonica TaxID=7064 RepID=A0AAW1N103_POPJA
MTLWEFRVEVAETLCLMGSVLFDVTVINAWILYKRAWELKGTSSTMTLWEFRVEVAETLCLMGSERAWELKGTSSTMTLWEFRVEVAETLCLMGSVTEKKRGRPSSSQVEDGMNAKGPCNSCASKKCPYG